MEKPAFIPSNKKVVRSCSELHEALTGFQLTKREMELSCLVRQGLPDQTAALKLDISVHTVKNHIKSIHRKLEVHSRGQLVALLNRWEENP